MDATERERLAALAEGALSDLTRTGKPAAMYQRDLARGVLAMRAEVERLTALVHAKESWIDGAKVDLDGLTEERNEARAALAEAEARWDEFVSEGHIEDGNRAGFCLCGAEWICPAWTENLSRDWQIESLTAERDRYRRQVEAVRALCIRDGYTTWDREKHLGPPPWTDEAAIATWEAVHHHDVRTKCYPEFGCDLYLDPEEVLDALATLDGAES